MPRPSVEYARYSPRPRKKSIPSCESIEWQFERLDSFCKALDFNVVGRYEDRAKSGKTTDGREGLEAAVAHAIKAKGILVVYDWSRLSRDIVDAFSILRRLLKEKAELRSVADAIATDTPLGRLNYGIQTLFNQYSREVTALKTSDSMVYHQYNGARRMGRVDRCPFGYRASQTVPGALEPDPVEMVTIDVIRSLETQGLHPRAICRELDAKEVPRRGKRWQGAHGLVASILARASA